MKRAGIPFHFKEKLIINMKFSLYPFYYKGKVDIMFMFGILMFFLSGCDKDCPVSSSQSNTTDYFVKKITKDTSGNGLVMLKVNSYQQTTDYTCGPSAVITLLKYFGKTGDELTIAGEMGTSTTCGTNPEQLTSWLSSHGFAAHWSENGTLEMLRANLANKIPTLVEWSDWGGHWVLVVGYDTRNTESVEDDVIIFADPYDRHDDNPDGIDWFNASRFYYMWYDALLFGKVMRRIYIQAIPE
jgi:hypothetical protein